ncbi:MAG: hypothetical protein CMG00_01750 [Candidatus Marinimicrobia bacterium]|nr:hypothetical protein [Candidatus Neomarinimicrobiota bacterium]
MIDKNIINDKFEPINDSISSIADTYGDEIVNQLIIRLELTLNQFLDDFKINSSKSFAAYWEHQDNASTRFYKKQDLEDTNKELNKNKGEIIPKFISNYKK